MQYGWQAETLCAGGAHWQQAEKQRRFGVKPTCLGDFLNIPLGPETSTN